MRTLTLHRALTLHRGLFVLALLGLCLISAAAQEYCPDKKTLRQPGKQCPPVPKKREKEPSPPKSCPITVKIEGEAPSARVHLLNNNDGCGNENRKTKGKTKAKPYFYSKTEIINGSGEVVFKGFLCRCNHTLTVEHGEYTFSDGGRRNVVYLEPPKPKDMLFTFKATPRVKPPPPPPPCNNSIPPEPIYLDAEPKPYQIAAESNCEDSTIGKRYYKDHSLKPDVRGYTIEVRLESEHSGSFDFKLLQGQSELPCSPVTPAGSNLQSWKCALPDDQSYLLRIIGKESGPAPNLGYRLSVHSRELNKEGYDDWMEKKILTVLGNTPGPNASPIINALSRQIDLSNTEKLRQAGELLEKLEDLTKTATYDKSLTSTLLAMIYRYHKKDFTRAREKETAAIEQGAIARFRVMIGEGKDLKRFSTYWLSIGKRGMRLEPLGDSENDKSSELNQKINMVKGTVSDNQTFNTADRQKIPIQYVKTMIDKKSYCILPLSYERDEANTISELIKKHIESAKK